MENQTEKTSLILHGHFYQPPRENPQTGVIPKQVSASPYEDWNERIFNDCYNANCYSRYLDNDGRIISLTNNYEYISFNFGPTLLHWLDRYHPDTIEMLKDADRKSIQRLGHGNAMAQGFNHTILPLDKIRDAELQIDWGIKDFQYHFGRDPEGMWLPECGVNANIIQLLSDAGIKFIILSPWQCKAVEDDSGAMVDLEGKPAPHWNPYILTGSNGGTINAFFYHPGLASGISFGHMLRSADSLYSSLLEIKNTTQKPLIHTATDGEIYGHHEPYGDMALAALIKKVEERDDFILDNYASYLEHNPAVKHAELHKGEAGKGTSWSCSHGVSRWYKDCGCHTGGENGWNQAWRTPLRNALNNLGSKLDEIFEENIKAIFSGKLSSTLLLKKAGDTFSGKESMAEFISQLHKEYKFSPSNDTKLSHLISGMKNKHFSFTSCGFFFSDISGIEPRQDINYALYAISMFQQFSKTDLLLPFLSDLRLAKSNIKTQGDGMSIAQEEMKGLSGKVEAILYFYLNRTLADKNEYKDSYGRFQLINYSENDSSPLIDIIDRESQEKFSFSVLPASSDCIGVNLYLSENSKSSYSIERYRVTNQEIPERIIDETLIWIDNAMTKIKFNELVVLSNHMKDFSTLVKNSKYTPMATMLLENLGLTLKLIKSLFIGHPYLESKERLETLGSMIDFVRKFGRESDIKSINQVLSSYLQLLSSSIEKDGLDDFYASEIITTLFLARAHGFEPETKQIQNTLYQYYVGKKASSINQATLKDVCSSLNFK